MTTKEKAFSRGANLDGLSKGHLFVGKAEHPAVTILSWKVEHVWKSS